MATNCDVQLESENEVKIPLKELPSPTDEYFRSIFNRADTDGDGKISIAELNRLIRNNSENEEPVPQSIVRRIHQIADTNQDGVLDFPEFVEMVNNPKFRKYFGRYVTKYINFVIPRKRGTGDELDTSYYEDEYSCWPPKLGMIIISLIEIIFFSIDEYSEMNSTKFASGPTAKLFIYNPRKRYEIWRYLTYMFVHIGYLHLVVNLVVQIFLGIPLEMVHGWWRVLIIYFTGVVAGSLGTSITDPTTLLAGASGGVYSLMTAHIATIIMNWKEMTYPAVQLAIFVLIICTDVSTSIYNRYWDNLDEHIGYVAHFAGAVAGLLVGISVLRNLHITPKENVIWWCAATLFTILMLIGICWNLFYPNYFPTPT